MADNVRFGKVSKTIWFKNEKEFNKLRDFCEGNYTEEAGALIKEIMIREENK